MPYLRLPPGCDDLATALESVGLVHGDTADGLVFVAAGPGMGEDWEAIRHELEEAFHLSQQTARAASNLVYVVAGEDLLGQRGPGAAMIANGLLAAARTAAFEGAKPGFTANVVAPEEGSEPAHVAVWIERMLSSTGATGELVRVGSAHLGKALP